MNEKYQNSIELYPYAYVYHGQKTILIWQAARNGDTFRLDENGHLVTSSTIEQLKNILGSESEKVTWPDYTEIDFDKFWTALRNLRINRASSLKTFRVLLDGWNFIEDLARTFQLSKEMESLRSPVLDKVYDKIFFGNNLPSVTPEGKLYRPLWTHEEISSLRRGSKTIWKTLRDLGHIRP